MRAKVQRVMANGRFALPLVLTAGYLWAQKVTGPTGMYCGGNETVQYARPIRATGLSGKVFDEVGIPLPGARVQVQVRGKDSLIVDMTADSEGQFRLPRLRRGAYWLGISAPGFDLHVWDLHIVRFGWTHKLNPRIKVGT